MFMRYSIIWLHTGAIARHGAAFGQGYGPIFLDDVRCNGREPFLAWCPYHGLEKSNCNHNKDAGVVCVLGKIIGLLPS